MSTAKRKKPEAQTGEKKSVDHLTFSGYKQPNKPTAEQESLVQEDVKAAISKAYQYRNADLDPQLIWRGKKVEDWSELIVSAPMLYTQEKVHPKALIDELQRQSKTDAHARGNIMADLFADFNGIPHGVDKTEFYRHEQNWTNHVILGDSLYVMASLAERDGLRGQVQCIYFDPPYGIKFNSNFQWSTKSRDVKDGVLANITREPEQVKAFRDTWSDGIHSYLRYLRDRLTVARDLLMESGSIFVQIGDENVHRVRCILDEVFGDENFVVAITVKKKGSQKGDLLENIADTILFYAKNKEAVKFRHAWKKRDADEDEVFSADLTGGGTFQTQIFPFHHRGRVYSPSANNSWKTNVNGMLRLQKADRILVGEKQVRYARNQRDFGYSILTNIWEDTGGATKRVYVVQTAEKIIQRCILMATDPGDLVLDPTCGSGTTAYVAEQWGRRWITIDTSRVSLALARARIMGARYPWYILADTREGQLKEAEITRSVPSSQPVYRSIRQGFVYERVPHITLKSIANNAEIDAIWEKWQETLEPLRAELNSKVQVSNAEGAWEEWEIPREADDNWSDEAKKLHAEWWQARIARQKEIDASIAAKAEYEYLYDKPYVDKTKVRVAGPFTVESLSPHRSLGVDENDELIDPLKPRKVSGADYDGFADMILDNLKTAGVQQANKADKLAFSSLTAWPGKYICAEGVYTEGDTQKKAGIFIGPEFGTVQKPDIVAAAREAGEAGFDVLVSCAFNYDAHSTDLANLGKIKILKARINADMHMGGELKNNGKGNLFVIFGEPDIDIKPVGDDMLQVKINGVDVFHPNTGEVRSNGADGIACWFIDTDYNEESFFVRHAYFLGAQDPYDALKRTLKAEINAEAWASLNSDTSRPFPKPSSGRIAVKVINHLGDEVMKVFRV